MIPLSMCALAILSSLWLFAGAQSINDADYQGKTISRDTCIIGGGSGGTYSAIRLAQEGKSVIVVEKQGLLGGHTNTYVDPVTKAPINYGVLLWDDIPVVRNYLSYLGVPLTLVNTSAPSPLITDFADFTSGTIVPSSALPQTDPGPAFAAYLAQLANYPFIDNGYDLPSPVPADLLLPFGDFIKKYLLDAMAYTAFLFNQGAGNILAQPTIYMMKYLSPLVVQGIATHFLTAASGDNHQLYDNALAKLGSSVLLNSTVHRIDRSSGDCIRVVVSTPTGDKLIKAKNLLITIPPKVENLSFLDLDANDHNLFAQFNNSYYYNGVIRNSGIPSNTSLNSIALKSPYGIPAMPGLYAIDASGLPNLHQIYYGSPYPIPAAQVQASILTTISKIVKNAAFPSAPGPAGFVAFGDHSPFELTVSTDAIKNGFYRKLNALQGKKNTWWTGATWQAQDSSLIWNFTESNILPGLLK